MIMIFFRSDCVFTLKGYKKKGSKVSPCEELKAKSVKDSSIWKWRDEVVASSTNVLTKLKFLNSGNLDIGSADNDEPRTK